MSDLLKSEVDLEAVLAAVDDEEAATRPDEPSLPPGEWMRKNLFSSPFNTVLSIVFALGALWAYRAILNFIFSENTQWDAVRINLRLMFTQAYPDENYTRVWVSLAIVAVLSGLSLGLSKVGRGLSLKKIATWCFGWGGLVVLGVLLREPSVKTDATGESVFADADGVELVRDNLGSLTYANGDPAPSQGLELVRESFGAAMGNRTGWWIIGLLLLAVGAAIWFGLGDFRRRNTFVPAIPFGLAGVGLLVSSTWWYGWGDYTFSEEGFSYAPGELVAESTRNPWTMVFLVLVASYLIGRYIQASARPEGPSRELRIASAVALVAPFLFLLATSGLNFPLGTLFVAVLAAAFLRNGIRLGQQNRVGVVRAMVNGMWLLAPFVTYWGVLRGPVLDWGYVAAVDLPLYLLFAVGGGLILWALTNPTIGETGRIIAVVILAVAAFTWIGAFFGWFGMLQKIRLSILFLGLAALLAPNFKGEAKQRMNLIYGWLGFVTIFHVMVTLINTPSSIEVPTEDFAGGFMVSIYVSIFTMLFSFPLGVLLALARTSRLPIFRVMSTVYIESFRGVPLITMLFFFTVFVNLFLPEGMELSLFAAVVVAFVLFSAAYLAENVRGGLQAIRRGQYEASDALGLTTVQRTAFIVLPQGLRVSIPPLVGQVIATFKETSLLAIVGVFDFLRMARDVIPAQTEFLGVRKPGLLFICVVYFVGAYAMSKYSQRLEKQLGVGER